MQYHSKQQQYSAGTLLILVLVFAGIFLSIIAAFIGSVVTQNKVVNFKYEQARATEIAEAGINYYKWRLAHYPDDVTDGTGLPGPYVHVYSDPEDGPIGEFSLSIASSTYCGSIASVEVTSTGHTYTNPAAVGIVTARYARPTVAEYSFITNGAVWYGDDRVITGPVHSNQGIRMDGYHNSYIGSGQATWTCDSSFGCGSNTTVDGVYTTSGHATPGLFTFPVSPVDFSGLTLDLLDMKNKAQNDGGIYYGPSGGYGYLVDFNGDDTVTIRRVTNTSSYWAYSSEEGWHTGERNVISNSSFVATRTIDDACPLLYFEDKVWLQGDVSQKVALAAANLSLGSQTNIVINDNINYVSGVNAGLLAIAEDDVDVGLAVPNNLQANGIFIAQNGRFGRNHYVTSGSKGLPGSLDPYVLRGTLTRYGSVVSNGRVGTQWVSGSVTVSGFVNRVTSFDADQVSDPPPLTPETSDVYELSDWQQEG
ncbi:hypothetical protein KC902_03500 [Candidatus Kaiserbacteria bacterium]|nr:hypothetical protein [Candidatus Kaiserbacteria bacterium]USN89200.1 MAG: hypothetical protein H6780_02170 [Candidatus Nomurabacteria bacterium]